MFARRAIYAALFTLTASSAFAQTNAVAVTLNFQYREPLTDKMDLPQARADILAAAERDCAKAEKTFGLSCSINDIQFNNFGMGMGFGNPGSGNLLSASVNAALRSQTVNQ